ncbi:MAG: alpha/beta hydrolase [Myxococcaceae bacterium]
MLHHAITGGSERPTLLLHGFLGSGRNLRTLANGWSKRDPARQLVMIDLPGHGESPPPPPGARLKDLAESVIQTVRALKLEPPWAICGHSMGARVGLMIAGQSPQEVASLAMLDVAPGPIPVERQTSVGVMKTLLAAPATAPDRKTMRDWLTGAGLSGPIADWLALNLESADGGVKWRIDRERLAQLHPGVSAEDLWPIAESRPAPLTVVRGARSHYVTDEDFARLTSIGALTATVQAGHDVHVEATDAVLDVVA